MPPRIPRILEVRTGRVAPFGDGASAYAKAPRAGAVHAHELGLDGDEQAARKVHGGPEKAIYAYAASNYAIWRAEAPQHADKLVPGAFGENLVVDGLDETGICIGDRWRIGDPGSGALIELCQPRNPCATLGRWFGDPGMVKRFLRARRSGWYCRVIRPGAVQAGDTLTLERRLDGAWTFTRMLGAADAADPALLETAAAHDRLATEWRLGLLKEAAAMRARSAKRAGSAA